MSSRQLQDLTPQELADHAYEIFQAARIPATGVRWAAARAARAAAAAVVRAEAMEDDEDDEEAENPVHLRAEAIAYLDILHRQQMLGEWPEHIDNAAIREQTSKASVIAEKQEVKKHMGSMLGDWDKAGKLSKRRIRKTKTKTKRRRQKITKRRRK
jgi:hypothetical protein